MSTATSGRAREYRIRDQMRTRGWILVMRSAGSKGVADLCLVHPDHGLALVQCGTANKNLSPDDRTAFTTLATLCNALALLAIAPPRMPIRYWRVTADVPSRWEEFEL